MYFILFLLGMVVLCIGWEAAKRESRQRQERYRTLLNTQFVCLETRLAADLCGTYFVLGRRKRKCDLCLADLNDPTISRIHAVLWWDGTDFCIQPVYQFHFLKPSRYTRVIVNGQSVPPSGVKVKPGDEIILGRSHFTIRRKTEVLV